MLFTVAPHMDLDRARAIAPAVVEELHRYDPRLLIVWDKAGLRWVVCRTNERGVHPQFIYQGEDGIPLPLDARLMDVIRASDRWAKAGNAQQFATKEASEIATQAAQLENEFNEEIEYAGAENRQSLARLGKLHRDLFG